MNLKPAFLNVLAVSCALVAALSGGCKSVSVQHYLSPRVEGRVLDQQSHLPVKDVTVQRWQDQPAYRTDTPPKGGEWMAKAPPVRTGADGCFVLDSVKDLALLRNTDWYSVSLSFQHPAYRGLITNYTIAQATNTLSGEPLVETGNILLVPLAK